MSKNLTPITREEYFLARAGGQDVATLTPITREECFLEDVCELIENVDTPTQEQVDSAVNDYLDEHGVVFNTSEEIDEILEG